MRRLTGDVLGEGPGEGPDIDDGLAVPERALGEAFAIPLAAPKCVPLGKPLAAPFDVHSDCDGSGTADTGCGGDGVGIGAP